MKPTYIMESNLLFLDFINLHIKLIQTPSKLTSDIIITGGRNKDLKIEIISGFRKNDDCLVPRNMWSMSRL